MASDVEIAAAERALGVAFPPSYRQFLRYFEPGVIGSCNYFGIGRQTVVGDVVMVNQLATDARPTYYVQFATDGEGCSLFLDTSRVSPAGECPVVVRGLDLAERTIACSFLKFLEIGVVPPLKMDRRRSNSRGAESDGRRE